ncbi:hypothetical protein B0O79_1545 [Flavobacteriaceae bacterium MAR_2009_75]|nr:hypothetical protein B0O79_1545 [Flavobacteriaceae bacterium MAR_2009_75]
MRKILVIVGVILAIFIGFLYVSLSSTDNVFSTCEILGVADIEKIDFTKHDSVLVAASTLYKSTLIKDIFQGSQYREVWAAPIKVPIVFLDTLKGGMEILKEGGGKQTHSLKLRSKDGFVFSLRGVNKDPKALIPEFAKQLGLENIIVDGISAQHPYAALAAAQLADRAGILHTQPEIFFVPKHKHLGAYNNKFGNRLFLFERETEGGANWTDFEQVKEIIDTDDLQELRKEHGEKVTIDKALLVRARLFDILIGDWDRHAKQWGWVIQEKNEKFIAIPLPGDRDNAFFTIEGILPTLISNRHILPGLQSFDKEIDYLPGLVMPFDIYFLKGTELELFLNEAQRLKSSLTDQSIDAAFEVWPENIRDLDAEEIANTIKIRRNNLLEYAQAFKDILEEREFLVEPLKGSEDKTAQEVNISCFDCNAQ